MTDLLPQEVLQLILVRLTALELLRLRYVSKSWLAAISDPSFVRCHVRLVSYTEEMHAMKSNGHRRILLSRSPKFWIYPNYEIDDDHFDNRDDCHLIGSCDGLVCVVSPRNPTQIIVLNPTTREVNYNIQKLDDIFVAVATGPVCWGFGHDTEGYGYYVMVGFRQNNDRTCFYVLTLRSNRWVYQGTTRCTVVSRIGIFYKESLHWIAKRGNNKVILNAKIKGFDETPQPDCMEYTHGLYRSKLMRLGILDGRLCLFRRFVHRVCEAWVMNNYNVTQSWSRYQNPAKFDKLYCLKPLERYVPNREPFCHAHVSLSSNADYVGALVYVESLVSPNAN